MKNIGKTIIFILIGFFALILIAGALGPKKMEVKRSITINQPVSEIFNYTTDYQHRLNWNPWLEQDPNARHTFQGESGQPGNRWTWSGEQIGKGYLEIKEIKNNKKLVSDLKFTEPWESQSIDIRKFEETPQGTKVIWITRSELSYPIERIVGIFMNNRMGSTISKGLQNLKNYANQQATMIPVIKTIEIDGMTCNGCEKTIQKTINNQPGVLEVNASHKKGIATVKVDSSQFDPSDYRKAIQGVGYSMKGVK